MRAGPKVNCVSHSFAHTSDVLIFTTRIGPWPRRLSSLGGWCVTKPTLHMSELSLAYPRYWRRVLKQEGLAP